MENFVPITCYENLKRYWRRKKYQRLHGSNHNNKRKMKIIRLGDDGSSSREEWNAGHSNKLKLTCLRGLFSPIKVLAKTFHDTYVDMMIRLEGNLAHKSTGAGAFAGKKVAKRKQIAVVSCGEELVDSKLVLGIFKRLAAAREMDSVAY